MAPNASKLQAALLDATWQVYKEEPDATTVNKVRKRAETNLGLDDGFFAGVKWKQTSKELIKTHVEKLLDGWEPNTKQEATAEDDSKQHKAKNGADFKRSSPAPEDASPAPKRRKRGGQQKSKNLKEELSQSDFSMGEEEDDVKPKKKKPIKSRARVKANTSDEEDAKPRSTKARTKIVSDDEDGDIEQEGDDVKASPTVDAKRKREKGEDEDTDMKDVPMKSASSDDGNEDKSAVKKRRLSDEEEAKLLIGDIKDEQQDSKPAVDEEEEYSDVIDEPPMSRGKKKGGVKKEPKAGKASGSSKKSATAPSAPEDPKEAEVKKLQGQLVKCGVRKLWHNELKQYGDDDRAKIRHLKKMLTDIGMDGRFSESKAREIKESRELLAEVEAAQDMDSLWGTSGRASRSRGKQQRKSMKIESDSEDSDDGKESNIKDEAGDDYDEEETTVAARRRARADLAFLGDDSDSD